MYCKTRQQNTTSIQDITIVFIDSRNFFFRPIDSTNFSGHQNLLKLYVKKAINKNKEHVMVYLSQQIKINKAINFHLITCEPHWLTPADDIILLGPPVCW